MKFYTMMLIDRTRTTNTYLIENSVTRRLHRVKILNTIRLPSNAHAAIKKYSGTHNVTFLGNKRKYGTWVTQWMTKQ